MVSVIQAIILGIIQGITEWLPVSSSGHLAIVQHFFGISQAVAFDVLLHLATLLVILVVFFRDIMKLFYSVFKTNQMLAPYRKMLLYIVVASIPTALIGYFLGGYFEALFDNVRVVCFMLIITGFIIYIAEKWPQGKNRRMNYYTAFFMGLMQGLSIIPGISRSGSTIATGLFAGIKREEAARFSFLMAVPAILGAGMMKAKDIIVIENLTAVIVGMFFAFVFGVLSLKWLLGLIRRKKLIRFSYYLWFMAILVLVISFLV